MGIKLFTLIFFIINSMLHATTFIPLPIEKQVESADLGLEAILETKDSFKTLNGHIYTNYKFKKVSAPQTEDNYFQFTLPGGTLNGISTAVENAPKFINGEKIFLLLKKVNNKVYLSNFTMGKFSIIKIDGETYYQNEIFPNQKGVGLVKKSEMEALLNRKNNDEKKSTVLFENGVDSTRNPKLVTGPNKREIASVENEKEKTSHWTVYFLACVGIFISLLLIKSRKDEK